MDIQSCEKESKTSFSSKVYLWGHNKDSSTPDWVSRSRVMLIKCTWLPDHQQVWPRKADVLAVYWSIQAWVSTMPRRKYISNDLRETIVASNQAGKDYKAISKQFGVRHSIRRILYTYIVNKLTIFSGACILASSPRQNNAERNSWKPMSYISNCTAAKGWRGDYLGLFSSCRTWVSCSHWVKHKLLWIPKCVLELKCSRVKVSPSVRQLKLGWN